MDNMDNKYTQVCQICIYVCMCVYIYKHVYIHIDMSTQNFTKVNVCNKSFIDKHFGHKIIQVIFVLCTEKSSEIRACLLQIIIADFFFSLIVFC